jgi:3-isopropylmalate/(R)-2-methylmalate dehydratase small subunit
MEFIMIIRGKSVVLNHNNVSTDQIFPGKYVNLTDPSEIANHVLEGLDPGIKQRIKPESILVVGKNFGCGSSREHAVIALTESGVRAVIAESAGRIWYRNAINLGLPVILLEEPAIKIGDDEELEIHLKEGLVKNISQEMEYQGEPVAEFILEIFESGGIKPMMRKKYASS